MYHIMGLSCYSLLLPPVSRQVFGTGAQSPGHPTRVLFRLGPIIMRGVMLSNIRPDYSHSDYPPVAVEMRRI